MAGVLKGKEIINSLENQSQFLKRRKGRTPRSAETRKILNIFQKSSFPCAPQRF
jgi:hypothetical protein